jgi:hypothetical protein
MIGDDERRPPVDPFFVGLALASALLHSGWNTFVKLAGDRLVAIANILLGFAVTGAAMIPLWGIPDRRSWGCLALITFFYYGYLWLLHRAYRIGDVSHAYPLFQGAAPLLSPSAVPCSAANGPHLSPPSAFSSPASES